MDIGLLAVFFGGIATVFTPCIFPILPVYLAIFSKSATGYYTSSSNLLFQTIYFGIGFSTLFILMGLGAAALSSFIAANKSFITVIGSVLIILMGLIYSGILKIDLLMREYRIFGKKVEAIENRFTSFVLGILFASSWSPCAGPILGAVLTYVALKSTNIFIGALYMLVYSIGVIAPFIVLSLFVDRLLPKVRQLNRFLPSIQKIGGLLLVFGGLVLLYSELPYLKATFSNKTYDMVKENKITQIPRVLFVFSKNCPECRSLKLLIPTIKNDCKDMQIQIDEVYIEDEPELKRRLRINLFPTIILFDKHGNEVKRIFGYQGLPDLRVAAASLINRECVDQMPDFEKIRSSNMRCQSENSCENGNYK
ncbi:MAG: sulfite exporter TauE/SafE family protein [Deltaproteobacteria bacterium]|nr:sulfite exporter TauE/SafE family protein [Deltaproteobacteria bacterium]